MGRIVDGRISGNLPEGSAFAINYPGYPSSLENALKTLGGMATLERMRTDESNFVELKFRPNDPFAHAAFGELRRTSDLLLRISKRVRIAPISEAGVFRGAADGNKARPTGAETGSWELQGAVVAQVEQTFSFEGMSDYQFVAAVHASESKKRKWVGENDSSTIGNHDTSSGIIPMLIPPLFSMRDMPEELFLRKPGTKKNKAIFSLAEPQATELPAFALDFKIKDVPKDMNWEIALTKGGAAWLRTEALVRLFQERRIWTRNMLNERLVEQGIFVTTYYLKVLLFRVAYYFGNGPFRNLWIRNGYDPRLDPESRSLQMIDYRVPTLLRDHVSSSVEVEEKCSFAAICAFKRLPEKKFTQFQLIDLQDVDIQSQIKSPTERATCSELTGWYQANTIKRLRQILRIRFLALYPGGVARTLEAVEQKLLQRLSSSDEERPDLNMQTCNDNDIIGYNSGKGSGGISTVTSSQYPVSDEVLIEDDLSAHEMRDEDEDYEDVGDEDIGSMDRVGINLLDDELEEEEELTDKMGKMSGKQQSSQNLPSGLDFLNPADVVPKNYLQALLGKFSLGPDAKGSTSAVEFDDEDQYPIYDQDEDDN